MYRAFYEGMSLVHLPVFTLLLFIAMFIGVLLRLVVFRRGEDLSGLAQMPLCDDGLEEKP